MSVNVSYKNTVHSYGVSRAMLVQNLKEEISNKQNLHQFKLMLDQAELIERCPVIKYLFTTFTLCYDDKEAAVEINDLTLEISVVNPQDQRVIREKATSEMTVGQLKENISRKLISSEGKWTLKKNGRDVPDGDLVKTHLIVKTFTVNIQDMNVEISFNKRNFNVIARSDMTVLEFKRLCHEKTGLQVNEIALTFNGEPLGQSYLEDEREKTKDCDQRTLGTYQITPYSSITVVTVIPGGLNTF